MIEFPLFRKYSNNRSYFKVLSFDEFEEIQTLGSNYRLDRFKAKILPERNFLADLIAMEDSTWEEISEKDYNEHLQNCVRYFKKMRDSL